MPHAVASRTDSSIDDDAAGLARAEYAEESRQRQAAEAEALASENARLRERREAAGPRTDFDIGDEEAGHMRAVLAEELQQRKASHAAQLGRENALMRGMVRDVRARSDHDITDEDAGRRRLELAQESAARKHAMNQALAEHNSAIRARIRAAAGSQRIDNKIDDEAAGRARREIAAAAAARRRDEARRIAQRNADMQRRLKSMRSKTDHRPGGRSSSSVTSSASSLAAGHQADPGAGGSGGSSGRVGTPRQARVGGAKSERSRASSKGSTPRNANGTPRSGAGGSGRGGGGHSSNPLGGVERARASQMRYNDYDDRPKSAFAPSGGVGSSSKPSSSRFGVIAETEAAEVLRLSQLFERNTNYTNTPIGEENNAQRYFKASEFKSNPRGGWSNKKGVPVWDPRPFRPVPYECRGLRPVVSKEPWQSNEIKKAWAKRDAGQAKEAKRGSSVREINMLPDDEAETSLDAIAGGYNYATATFVQLDDGKRDSVAQLFNRRVREDALIANKTRRDAWDGSAWRYVPPALRGLKPVTDEPWARDEMLFDRFIEM